MYLASYGELTRRFGLFVEGECEPQVDSRGRVACICAGCLRWRAFLNGQPADATRTRYEVHTREHVAALASYLQQRRSALVGTSAALTVLEVGAGSGELSWHLRAALTGCGVELTATDSGARGLHEQSPAGVHVLLESCAAALLRVRPHVVLACWMPLGVDWTAAFRSCESVREYVLIGEADSGMCGDAWRTWGIRNCDEKVIVPPYEADRFERVDLEALSQWQLCRADERWASRGRSRTVVFRQRGSA